MSAQNTKVLIVEDSDDMRDLMKLLLEEAGYQALTAADGREALKYIDDESEFIDLVITDVQMPEVTGHEILSAVRARRGETPVIVITAFGSVETMTYGTPASSSRRRPIPSPRQQATDSAPVSLTHTRLSVKTPSKSKTTRPRARSSSSVGRVTRSSPARRRTTPVTRCHLHRPRRRAP